MGAPTRRALQREVYGHPPAGNVHFDVSVVTLDATCPVGREQIRQSAYTMPGQALHDRCAADPTEPNGPSRADRAENVHGPSAEAEGPLTPFPAEPARYSTRRPEMARLITSCWICSVPSKMS